MHYYITTYLQRSVIVLILIALLSACSEPATTTPPPPTATLPPPQAFTTSVPSAEAAASKFLQLWEQIDTAGMYEMLTVGAREAVSEENFTKRYMDFAGEAALSELEAEITSRQISPTQAEIGYKVEIQSAIVGNLQREMKMKLLMEQGEWRVDWNDGMILPELAGGHYLSLDRDTPARGTIYDRNGNPLASQTDAVAIGVWPDYVELGESNGLLALLSALSNYRSDRIVEMIENAIPGEYIPLGEVPADQNPRQIELLSTWGAAVVSAYSRRLYYGDGIGPHITGYVSAIQADEVETFRRQGYRPDERVGRKGLEAWGEQILGGKRGGVLYVFNPDGTPVGELGASPSEPGQDLYTTFDSDFQRQAQKAMSVYRGAIVVLERDTGRVLAMVSSPGFDPNAYEFDNYNWSALLEEISNDTRLPQFNRAAQGQYPLGSVFKVITMSAALESERYTPESTLDCQYTFEELPGFTRYDWTWDHFQEDGETQPSGLLTLPQGLIKSCNPWFWHIGLDLFNAGLTQSIAEMSRGFGLGSKTGIEGIDEEAGNIPEPATAVDAINLAIGQGEMLVTPLQVARFMAAIGNGGTLLKPQLIERITDQDGVNTFEFEPIEQGKLPLKPNNLSVLQEAMRGVVISEKPRGTAWKPMAGLEIPLAGKTGTATAPAGDPHAWFAGYTFAGRENQPDIAVVVIAENAGEGSEVAAPIFRRIIELYFFGKPLRAYPWEAAVDVTRSPTSPATDTPAAQPNINP